MVKEFDSGKQGFDVYIIAVTCFTEFFCQFTLLVAFWLRKTRNWSLLSRLPLAPPITKELE